MPSQSKPKKLTWLWIVLAVIVVLFVLVVIAVGIFIRALFSESDNPNFGEAKFIELVNSDPKTYQEYAENYNSLATVGNKSLDPLETLQSRVFDIEKLPEENLVWIHSRIHWVRDGVQLADVAYEDVLLVSEGGLKFNSIPPAGVYFDENFNLLGWDLLPSQENALGISTEHRGSQPKNYMPGSTGSADEEDRSTDSEPHQ